MRVLVTGSRDWDVRYKINMILNELKAMADILNSQLTIVHGACPTGADFYADQWANYRSDVKAEQWPARWELYGKAAGPRRNEAMVDAGADMCLAFLRGNSPGTSQTIALARTAGIPTFVINYESVDQEIETLSPGPG
jgi:hypothetical protein